MLIKLKLRATLPASANLYWLTASNLLDPVASCPYITLLDTVLIILISSFSIVLSGTNSDLIDCKECSYFHVKSLGSLLSDSFLVPFASPANSF